MDYLGLVGLLEPIAFYPVGVANTLRDGVEGSRRRGGGATGCDPRPIFHFEDIGECTSFDHKCTFVQDSVVAHQSTRKRSPIATLKVLVLALSTSHLTFSHELPKVPSRVSGCLGVRINKSASK